MKKIELEIIDFKATRMIGRKTIVKLGGNAKKVWSKFLTDGSNDLLQLSHDRMSPKGNCIGWMGDFNPETKMFVEMPGVFMNPDSHVPDGFDYIDIKACKVAILWIIDNQPNLEKGAHNLLLKHLNKTDYIADYSAGFSLEYYTHIGYVSLDKENPTYKFGYVLPCKRKD